MPSTSDIPSTEGPSDEASLQKITPKAARGILSTKVADACLDWVVFPALLFIQFGATMYCQTKEGLPVMDWKVVHLTILAFCCIAGAYRHVLRKNSDSIALLLLPEIFTNVLLAMVMLGSVALAYSTLVVLTLTLGVLGLVLFLWSLGPQQPDDYAILKDEEEGEDDENNWLC
jgi:cbb3-type cytochrome oxidase maturation protein